MEVNKKTLVLDYKKFLLLHKIIMTYPHGYEASSLDMDLQFLMEMKFVKKMIASPRYVPTEEGVRHAGAGRKGISVDQMPEQFPGQVHPAPERAQ